MANDNDSYLSVTEAAGDLGITRQRVLQLIEDGRLDAQKVGNSYIIKKSALNEVRERKPGRPAKPKAVKKSKAK